MNKVRPLIFIAILITFFSCEKEYSEENLTSGDDFIVGLDCRISAISSRDTSGMAGGGLGSITAEITSTDIVKNLIEFDSVANFPTYIGQPVYTNDTVYIDPEEYYIVDINKRITKSHLWVDITFPASEQFDVFYAYNASGYLTTKTYFSTTTPGIPFLRVDYTYAGGNLVRMTAVDLPGGDLNMDADMVYYPNIVARRFLYIFPDERFYPQYNQFFNFGAKNFNAIKKMVVRNYDPGNVVRDSLPTNFSNYILSRDNYVLSVQTDSISQPSIPFLAGKLSFSYHCK
jgi:hypothetical protein